MIETLAFKAEKPKGSQTARDKGKDKSSTKKKRPQTSFINSFRKMPGPATYNNTSNISFKAEPRAVIPKASRNSAINPNK